MVGHSNKAWPLREVLLHRGYLRWSVATQLVRLPALMTSLAFVLVGTYATGSVAVGGLMVTVYVVCLTLFAPLMGRLLDRLGPATGLPRLLGFASLALCGLATAAVLKVAAIPLLLIVGIAGALAAGATGAMRSLLSNLMPKRLLAPALAIDSTVIELVVITAPLLVAIAAAPSPPGAIVAMAGVTAAAALLVRSLRAGVRMSAAVPEFAIPQTPWNSRFRFWIVVSIAFGHALGTAETGALPLARRLGGGAGEAAVLIATLAAASALSGAAYAGLSHRLRVRAETQVYIMVGLMAAGCFGLAVSTSWTAAAAALVLLGVCTAPLNTVRSYTAEQEIPPSRKSEGFGLINASHSIGFALGGLFLALLPLTGMLAVGGVSAVASLALAPVLIRCTDTVAQRS